MLPVLLILFGCAPQKPGCTDTDLTALALRHEARLAAACINQRADCSQRTAENKRYHDEIQAYVGCR